MKKSINLGILTMMLASTSLNEQVFANEAIQDQKSSNLQETSSDSKKDISQKKLHTLEAYSPRLVTPIYITVNQGKYFDPAPQLNNVHAQDHAGVDITEKIKIKQNNVQTNSLGIYTITYEVKDISMELTITEDLLVVVTP